MSKTWERIRIVVPAWDDDFYFWGNAIVFAFFLARWTSGEWFTWQFPIWFAGLTVARYAIGWTDAWCRWTFTHPRERAPSIRDYYRL